MSRYTFTAQARQDIQEIIKFIARENPLIGIWMNFNKQSYQGRLIAMYSFNP